MTRRDIDKLDKLLLQLTAEFSSPHRMTTTIGRGDARAIVAAIRELKRLDSFVDGVAGKRLTYKALIA